MGTLSVGFNAGGLQQHFKRAQLCIGTGSSFEHRSKRVTAEECIACGLGPGDVSVRLSCIFRGEAAAVDADIDSIRQQVLLYPQRVVGFRSVKAVNHQRRNKKRAAPLRPALKNLLPEMYKLTNSGGILRVAPVRFCVLNRSDYPRLHQ